MPVSSETNIPTQHTHTQHTHTHTHTHNLDESRQHVRQLNVIGTLRYLYSHELETSKLLTLLNKNLKAEFTSVQHLWLLTPLLMWARWPPRRKLKANKPAWVR